MEDEKKQTPAKKPYEKPVLRVIELAAEEVLAVGCKTKPPGPRAFGNPTPACIVPRTCFGQGS